MRYFALLVLATISSSIAIARDHGRTKAESLDGSPRSRSTRALEADKAADVMARNILEWIQGLYQRQYARKPRQQSENEYLPPYTSSQRPPDRPRPFQPATTDEPSYPSPNINEVNGYNRPSPSISPPNDGYSSKRPFPPFPSTSNPTYPTSVAPKPFSPSPSTPTTSEQPGEYPDYDGYPSNEKPQPDFPTPGGRPSTSTPGGSGVSRPGTTVTRPETFPTRPGTTVTRPGTTVTRPSGGTSTPGNTVSTLGTGTIPGRPSTTGGTRRPTTSPPLTIPTSIPGRTTRPSTSVGTGGDNGVETDQDEDSKHPPHIHKIDVECSKTMMTINIEFNRLFDGIIYSKGFFATPECRYVEQNSGKTEYSFTVSLDSCGTQFINDFEGDAGQAYLENVLVLQNEPGIQEVWDTVRNVRCLWEGNINKALSVTLAVDMLNQETVTFSGDTASAKLDLQIGRGPFAPAATGLVKIGETMTLVISVEGDPGFDLNVRDCIARDELSTNVVKLTDDRGCILKPKFFGAFQKTKETGNTGASIIAYAFFQAFKFPDVMDLFIECNVELCKTNCEACPEGNQQIEPGRRRRRSVMYDSVISSAANYSNRDLGTSPPVRVARGFRVVMPEDLSPATAQVLENIAEGLQLEANARPAGKSICLCDSDFYSAFSVVFVALALSAISTAVFYVKLHRTRASAIKTIDLTKGS